jgi:hypothetical protein
VVDEWRLRPEGNDNHWLDGVVGCAVGASMQGIALPGTATPPPKIHSRLRLSSLRANHPAS